MVMIPFPSAGDESPLRDNPSGRENHIDLVPLNHQTDGPSDEIHDTPVPAANHALDGLVTPITSHTSNFGGPSQGTPTPSYASGASVIGLPRCDGVLPVQECRHSKEARRGSLDNPSWHPYWLRPVVLGSFSLLFIFVAACSVSIAIYSRLHDGLSDANNNAAFVWKFGPTALFTLITVFWARSELQALRYMPWFLIQLDGPDARDYELDYTAMLFPEAFLQSLKRKHYLIAIAILITLALRVQIALSSSIFHSTRVRRNEHVDVEILSYFQAGTNYTLSDSSLNKNPYASAIQEFGLNRPFGVGSDCAYQTFSAVDSNDNPIVPTPSEPITVVVDGIFTDMQCRPLSACTVLAPSMEETATTAWDMELILKFEDCDGVVHRHIPNPDSQFAYSYTAMGLDAVPGTGRPCSDLPQQNKQWMFFDYSIEIESRKATPRIEACEAVLCTAQAWVSKVEVVYDGIGENVTAMMPPGSRTSFNIDPVQLLTHSETWEYIDRMGLKAPGPGYEPHTLNDDYARSRANVEFYQGVGRNFTCLMIHEFLRKERRTWSYGKKTRDVDRLQAHLGVCLSTAVLSAACAVLAILSIRQAKHFPGSYHRDPATILGAMVYLREDLQHHRLVRLPPKTFPSHGIEASKAPWSQAAHASFTLTSTLRVLLVLFASALITCLVLTLKRSTDQNGLLTVGHGSYWPPLSRSLPVVAMLTVALYSSSVGAAMKSLAALSDLSSRPRTATDLDVSLLDMLGARLLRYTRLKSPKLSLIVLLSALSGFLPVISSNLLETRSVPKVVDITIPPQPWFRSHEITTENVVNATKNRRTLNNLILLHKALNFTSPTYTYHDLLFPTLRISDPSWGPGASTRIETSAAKLMPSCHRLSEDEFRGVVGDSWPVVGAPPAYSNARACPNDTRSDLKDYLEEITVRSTGGPVIAPATSLYIGSPWANLVNPMIGSAGCDRLGMASPSHRSHPPWFIQTYVWGKNTYGNAEFDHLAVWNCNYTWMHVTVDVGLQWAERGFQVDREKPPLVYNSTIRPWDPPFGVPILNTHGFPKDDEFKYLFHLADTFDVYPLRNTFREPAVLATQFYHIMKPYGKVTVTDLGNPGREHQVLEALHSTLAFAAAQLANLENRIEVQDVSENDSSSVLTKESSVTGTIRDGREQRLLQNPNVTFVLVAILSLLGIVHLWGWLSACCRQSKYCRNNPWLLDLVQRGIAPPGHNSVGMMAYLLDGSNCGTVLPIDAHMMAPGELHRHLVGREFRLGWFHNTQTGKGVYTIGVLNAGNLVFKSSKAEYDMVSDEIRETAEEP